MRFRLVAVAALLAGCAGAPVRLSSEAEELKELRSQIQAQSILVAQQQRRIEELEVKLAALAAKAQPAAGHPASAAPARHDPRPPLKTVKVGGRLRRTDRINPVERAPSLPILVELKEPDEEALARLDSDPTVAREFDADHIWAEAVQKLNDGRHAEAETDLLAFVAAYPRHSAADNALFLAGLVREVRGDCAGALQLFETVPLKYPAGDAVPQAQLERGRCLRILGRKDEAKSVLKQLAMEHPHASETAQSRQLLQDL
ncbi:MAG TPA: tetratricopeptide repeat protein [Myxococcales bacterium]